MEHKIERIRATFLLRFRRLGDNKEQILDELDMAVYQHREFRDTVYHDALLIWADQFLSAMGIE